MDAQRQIAELQEQIRQIEAVRRVFGDALTDQKKAELEAQLHALQVANVGSAQRQRTAESPPGSKASPSVAMLAATFSNLALSRTFIRSRLAPNHHHSPSSQTLPRQRD